MLDWTERYLRLTPAYLYMLMFYMYVNPHLISGPHSEGTGPGDPQTQHHGGDHGGPHRQLQPGRGGGGDHGPPGDFDFDPCH